MADVNSTEDRGQEEPRKGWRERLGGWVRSALRITGTVVGEAAKSRTATYVGVAMMAAGAMMSLTGVGAVAGGPLMIAGEAVAAGSVALRVRDGASRGQAAAAASDKAPDRQPVQDFSSRSEQSRPPAELHAVGPPGSATDMDRATHLAQATAALTAFPGTRDGATGRQRVTPLTADGKGLAPGQGREHSDADDDAELLASQLEQQLQRHPARPAQCATNARQRPGQGNVTQGACDRNTPPREALSVRDACTSYSAHGYRHRHNSPHQC